MSFSSLLGSIQQYACGKFHLGWDKVCPGQDNFALESWDETIHIN